MNESDEQEARTLIALPEYRLPAMPTDESVRRLGGRLIERLWPGRNGSRDKADPFIADESLATLGSTRLDDFASPPACGGLNRDVANTFREWVRDDDEARRVHWVVMPPCDRNHVIESWATLHGLTVASPPDAADIIRHRSSVPSEKAFGERPNDPDADVVVIPRLERWFRRHHAGLDHLRELFRWVQKSDRKFILGCNTWTYLMLPHLVDGGDWLPKGLIFSAFNANRLSHWFEEISQQDRPENETRPQRFRLAQTGQDVFDRDGDQVQGDFFHTLAAQANGIPWVAWDLWRRSIRVGPDADRQNDQKFPDEQTVWITPASPVTPPRNVDGDMLLIMHSLLIHDGLSLPEIEHTTPVCNIGGALSNLLASDWVCRRDDRYHCRGLAYPQVCLKLAAAGFSVPIV